MSPSLYYQVLRLSHQNATSHNTSNISWRRIINRSRVTILRGQYGRCRGHPVIKSNQNWCAPSRKNAVYFLCRQTHTRDTVMVMARQLTHWYLHGDTTWRHRSWSTLVQVMACCLTAPNHYLNQCWPIISWVLWHACEGYFTGNAQDMYDWDMFEIYTCKIIALCLPGRAGWGLCSKGITFRNPS